MVFFLIGMERGAQCVQQRVQRMLLVGADFIKQAVEPFDGQIVFLLISRPLS